MREYHNFLRQATQNKLPLIADTTLLEQNIKGVQ